VFAVSLLPQFLTAHGPVFWSSLTLGAVWAAVTGYWYLLFTWAVDRGRRLVSTPGHPPAPAAGHRLRDCPASAQRSPPESRHHRRRPVKVNGSPPASRTQGGTMNATALARAARHMAGVIAECHYAGRRMTALRITPDKCLAGDTAAGTYAEFLFRTSGSLLHKPPAARRAHGQPVS
jgi:hypothetical protein